MPAPLTGTVVGRFLTSDRKPLRGKVFFTLDVDAVLAPSEPAVYADGPVTAQLSPSGELWHQGLGVVLVASSDASLNPTGFTYTVSFDLFGPDGKRVKKDPFSISVPAGGTVDLAVVAPVAALSGSLAVVEGGTPDGPVVSVRTRRGLAAEWTAVNPVLAAGERGFETDTGLSKVGDGVTAWVGLAYEGATYATGNVHFIVSDTEPTETTVNGRPVVWIDTSTTGSADTTAPSAVTGLAAGTPTTTTIPLSWTAATDNTAVTGYEYSLTGGTTWTSTGSTGTTYTVTGLTQGTAYTIQVRAFDAAGNKGVAASVTATTAASADTTAPTAPTNLAGTAGATTMALSWTASTDAVGVTGYRVSKDNGATWITSSVTGTTYQVTGLTAGTSYTFAVAARDAAGNWSTNATLVKSTNAAVAYATEVAADSPTVYLPLDGSVVNSGSTSDTFTATALTYGASLGDGTQAAIFDGSTSKVTSGVATTAGLSGATSFTIEALVKMDAVVSKYIAAQTNTFDFNTQSTGRPVIKFQNTAAATFTAAPSASLNIGQTYHLAAVYDGATLKCYVNGVEQASVAASGTLPAYNIALHIGADGPGTGAFFDGVMDAPALYKNKALSAARILAHAQAAGVA